MNEYNDLTIWCTYHNDLQIFEYGLDYVPFYIKLFNANDLNLINDNINYLNPHLCELVTYYYVWKNQIKSKYVGFCHYRRFFKKIDINNLNKFGIHYLGYFSYNIKSLYKNVDEGVYNKQLNDKLYTYLKSLNICDNSLLYDFFYNDKILNIPWRLSYIFTWDMFNKFCTTTFGFLEYLLPNFKDEQYYLNTGRQYAYQFEIICGIILGLLSNNAKCINTSWGIVYNKVLLTKSNNINDIKLWVKKNTRTSTDLFILNDDINFQNVLSNTNILSGDEYHIIKNISEIPEYLNDIIKLDINQYIKCKDPESFINNNYNIEIIKHD